MCRNFGSPRDYKGNRFLLTEPITDEDRELLGEIEGRLMIAIANKFLKESAVNYEFNNVKEARERVQKYRHWEQTHKALSLRKEERLQ